MKIPLFLSMLAALALLILSGWHFTKHRALLALREKAETRQAELAATQKEIQAESLLLQNQQQQLDSSMRLARETGPAILRDLAETALASSNEKISTLLAKHGFTVTANKPADNAPAPEPQAEGPDAEDGAEMPDPAAPENGAQ